MRVLVTGCGNDIGNSIGRTLKEAGLCSYVMGVDLHDEHPGSFIYDKCEIVVPVAAANYFDCMYGLIEKHKIDVVLPSSEAELRAFTNTGFTGFEGVKTIMSNSLTRKIGFDKLQTANFLKEHHLLYPKTLDAGAYLLDPFAPCVVKLKLGAGSKDIFYVKTVDEGLELATKYPNHIFQELLEPADQEYTCGVYRDKAGAVYSIAIRRKLKGGATIYGEVVCDNGIDALLHTLAEKMELHGSMNVQLRYTTLGPIVFEINPRFSSTLRFRHLMGFPDLVASLAETVGVAVPVFRAPIAGTKIYRGYTELILYPPSPV